MLYWIVTKILFKYIYIYMKKHQKPNTPKTQTHRAEKTKLLLYIYISNIKKERLYKEIVLVFL